MNLKMKTEEPNYISYDLVKFNFFAGVWSVHTGKILTKYNVSIEDKNLKDAKKRAKNIVEEFIKEKYRCEIRKKKEKGEFEPYFVELKLLSIDGLEEI